MMKMNSEDLSAFVGKNVRIVLKNNFIYRGLVVKIRGNDLVLDDIKIGMMVIDSESIAVIGEC